MISRWLFEKGGFGPLMTANSSLEVKFNISLEGLELYSPMVTIE